MAIADPMLLLAQALPLWVYQHVPSAVFVFCVGACVGSFINVVIYRLPAGMSVITPPSRCPTCGAKLKFFGENLPIVGWFLVRGRCRYCGVKISPQYMIIETVMALLFLGAYVALFMTPAHDPWWGAIGGPWWVVNGLWRVWPVFIAYVFMLAGLLAMTIVDARTFTIPIQIPVFITITAFIAYPLQALLPHRSPEAMTWPIQGVTWTGALMAICGMLGIAIGMFLLKTGRLRYSFADYHEFLPGAKQEETASHSEANASENAASTEPVRSGFVTAFELLYFVPVTAGLVAGMLGGAWVGVAVGVGACIAAIVLGRVLGLTFGPESQPSGDDVLAPDYPHARREMKWEVLYLLPCMIGLIAGWLIARQAGLAGSPPAIVQAIGASFAGYLIGGGLVWGIRILGTLVFGREAMGLGDVHLLGAIGAVLGWFDPIVIFFIAPFSGLLWVVVSMGVMSIFRRARGELPYGPHLAVATLTVMLLRPGLQEFGALLFPGLRWPPPGLW